MYLCFPLFLSLSLFHYAGDKQLQRPSLIAARDARAIFALALTTHLHARGRLAASCFVDGACSSRRCRCVGIVINLRYGRNENKIDDDGVGTRL